MKRKIAAIMCADVVGYSRLVADDEEEALRRLMSYRSVFEAFTEGAGGRIFNTAGDAILAEFPSAVEAVRAAIDIQESLRTRNLAYPKSRQMHFRIGITIGDVVEQDGDLLGDAVNVAARLQTLSQTGGICLSQSVREQVSNKLSAQFRDLGPQSVKNIPQEIRAYTVELGESRAAEDGDAAPAVVQPAPARPARRLPVAAIALVLVALVAGASIAYLVLAPGSEPRLASSSPTPTPTGAGDIVASDPPKSDDAEIKEVAAAEPAAEVAPPDAPEPADAPVTTAVTTAATTAVTDSGTAPGTPRVEAPQTAALAPVAETASPAPPEPVGVSAAVPEEERAESPLPTEPPPAETPPTETPLAAPVEESPNSMPEPDAQSQSDTLSGTAAAVPAAETSPAAAAPESGTLRVAPPPVAQPTNTRAADTQPADTRAAQAELPAIAAAEEAVPAAAVDPGAPQVVDAAEPAGPAEMAMVTPPDAETVAVPESDPESDPGTEPAAPLPVARPQPPFSAEPMKGRPFHLESIPFICDDCRARIARDFAGGGTHRALAINIQGDTGWAWDWKTVQGARDDATKRCRNHNGRDCELFAVDSTIVWDRPAPVVPNRPWVHPGAASEPFDAQKVAYISEERRQSLADSYQSAENPKALAVARGGAWSYFYGGASDEEVMRRALEVCSYHAEDICVIAALNDKLVNGGGELGALDIAGAGQ